MGHFRNISTQECSEVKDAVLQFSIVTFPRAQLTNGRA